MNKMRPLNLLIVTVSALALAACTSWFDSGELKVTPVNKMSGLTGEPRDPLYESAVTAINGRDYARALDYLQEAKARNPGNVKVLNALGVVYDKLGRFDLSARYYAQARAIDPDSRVLAANMSYSNALQGLTEPRGPIARLDLPENFNPGPGGNPTVLASAAKAAVQPPASAAASRVAANFAQAGDIVKPSPRLVEAGEVVPHGPEQLAWVAPQFAPPEAQERSSANGTDLSAMKSAIAAPALRKLAEAPQIVSVPKPRAMAIGPVISAPGKLAAEVPKIEAISNLEVAAAPPLAKPNERQRRAQLPAVPATVKLLPRRPAAAPAKKKVFIIGQPVRIMNASGKPDRVGTVSRRLSALGWTVRLAEAGRTQSATTLVYNPRNIGAASAMQRTLPFPVRLVAESGSPGMRLMVGRDYLSWKSKNVRLHALWQKAPTVALLLKQPYQGVR